MVDDPFEIENIGQIKIRSDARIFSTLHKARLIQVLFILLLFSGTASATTYVAPSSTEYVNDSTSNGYATGGDGLWYATGSTFSSDEVTGTVRIGVDISHEGNGESPTYGFRIKRNGSVIYTYTNTTNFNQPGFFTHTYDYSTVDAPSNVYTIEVMATSPITVTSANFRLMYGIINAPVITSPQNNTGTTLNKINFTWQPTNGSISYYEYQLSRNADFSNPDYSSTVSTNYTRNLTLWYYGNYYFRARAYESTNAFLTNWSNTTQVSYANLTQTIGNNGLAYAGSYENVTKNLGNGKINIGNFTDTFDNNTNNGWWCNVLATLTCSFANGYLRANASAAGPVGSAYIIHNNTVGFQNYLLVSRVTINTRKNTSVLIGNSLRYSPSPYNVLLHYWYASGSLNMGWEENGAWKGVTPPGGNTTSVFGFTNGTFYTFMSYANGNTQRFKYWTGSTEPDWYITTTNSNLTSGKAGFYVSDSTTDIDYIWIIGLNPDGSVKWDGNYTDAIQDIGTTTNISAIGWNGTSPANSGVTLYINTSLDSVTWSGKQLIATNATMGSVYGIPVQYQNRYYQITAYLQGNNLVTPEINNFNVYSFNSYGNVSGYVNYPNGTGMPNARVLFFDNSTVTDANGFYNFTAFPLNTNVSLVAGKSGYDAKDSYVLFNGTNQTVNFTLSASNASNTNILFDDADTALSAVEWMMNKDGQFNTTIYDPADTTGRGVDQQGVVEEGTYADTAALLYDRNINRTPERMEKMLRSANYAFDKIDDATHRNTFEIQQAVLFANYSHEGIWLSSSQWAKLNSTLNNYYCCNYGLYGSVGQDFSGSSTGDINNYAFSDQLVLQYLVANNHIDAANISAANSRINNITIRALNQTENGYLVRAEIPNSTLYSMILAYWGDRTQYYGYQNASFASLVNSYKNYSLSVWTKQGDFIPGGRGSNTLDGNGLLMAIGILDGSSQWYRLADKSYQLYKRQEVGNGEYYAPRNAFPHNQHVGVMLYQTWLKLHLTAASELAFAGANYDFSKIEQPVIYSDFNDFNTTGIIVVNTDTDGGQSNYSLGLYGKYQVSNRQSSCNGQDPALSWNCAANGTGYFPLRFLTSINEAESFTESWAAEVTNQTVVDDNYSIVQELNGLKIDLSKWNNSNSTVSMGNGSIWANYTTICWQGVNNCIDYYNLSAIVYPNNTIHMKYTMGFTPANFNVINHTYGWNFLMDDNRYQGNVSWNGTVLQYHRQNETVMISNITHTNGSLTSITPNQAGYTGYESFGRHERTVLLSSVTASPFTVEYDYYGNTSYVMGYLFNQPPALLTNSTYVNGVEQIPDSPVNSTTAQAVQFNVGFTQNLQWINFTINGTLVQSHDCPANCTSDNMDFYLNSSGIVGNYTVSAIGSNEQGNATKEWVWNVAQGSFIPPTPVNLAYTNGSIARDGTIWVNWTWDAGSGNVTDSYNITHNGAWTNGTTVTFLNNTLGSGSFSNISVYAYNNSRVLNSTSVDGSVKLPTVRNWYVSADGANTNDGLSIITPKKNWSSIWFNSTNILPGDTIYLINGTWSNETITIPASGNITYPITLTSYNGTPTMDGLDNSYDRAWRAITISTKSYITISNITIHNYNVGIRTLTAHYINISNVTVYNTTGEVTSSLPAGIVFTDTNNSIVENSVIHDNGGIMLSTDCGGGKFYGQNTIGIISGSTDVKSSHNITIRNNLIYNNPGTSKTGTSCGHNLIDIYNGNTATARTRDIIIENNTIYDDPRNQAAIYTHIWDASAVPVETVTIRNNNISNTTGVALDHAKDSTVENNTFGQGGANSYAVIIQFLDILSGNHTIKNNTEITAGLTASTYITANNSHTISVIENNTFDYYRQLGGAVTVKNPAKTTYTLRSASSSNIINWYTEGFIFTENGANTTKYYSDRSEYVTTGAEIVAITKYNMTARPSTGTLTLTNNSTSINMDVSNQSISKINITIGTELSKKFTISNSPATNYSVRYSINNTEIENTTVVGGIWNSTNIFGEGSYIITEILSTPERHMTLENIILTNMSWADGNIVAASHNDRFNRDNGSSIGSYYTETLDMYNIFNSYLNVTQDWSQYPVIYKNVSINTTDYTVTLKWINTSGVSGRLVIYPRYQSLTSRLAGGYEIALLEGSATAYTYFGNGSSSIESKNLGISMENGTVFSFEVIGDRVNIYQNGGYKGFFESWGDLYTNGTLALASWGEGGVNGFDDLFVIQNPSTLLYWNDIGISNAGKNITITALTLDSTSAFDLYSSKDNITFALLMKNVTSGQIINITASTSNRTQYLRANISTNISYPVEISDIWVQGDSNICCFPNISDWNNTITSDNDLSLSTTQNVPVNFSIVYNQTGSVHWYNDYVLQSNITDWYNTSWAATGVHNVRVTVSNVNGTSDYIDWFVTTGVPPPPVQYCNATVERIVDITISDGWYNLSCLNASIGDSTFMTKVGTEYLIFGNITNTATATFYANDTEATAIKLAGSSNHLDLILGRTEMNSITIYGWNNTSMSYTWQNTSASIYTPRPSLRLGDGNFTNVSFKYLGYCVAGCLNTAPIQAHKIEDGVYLYGATYTIFNNITTDNLFSFVLDNTEGVSLNNSNFINHSYKLLYVYSHNYNFSAKNSAFSGANILAGFDESHGAGIHLEGQGVINGNDNAVFDNITVHNVNGTLLTVSKGNNDTVKNSIFYNMEISAKRLLEWNGGTNGTAENNTVHDGWRCLYDVYGSTNMWYNNTAYNCDGSNSGGGLTVYQINDKSSNGFGNIFYNNSHAILFVQGTSNSTVRNQTITGLPYSVYDTPSDVLMGNDGYSNINNSVVDINDFDNNLSIGVRSNEGNMDSLYVNYTDNRTLTAVYDPAKFDVIISYNNGVSSAWMNHTANTGNSYTDIVYISYNNVAPTVMKKRLIIWQ